MNGRGGLKSHNQLEILLRSVVVWTVHPIFHENFSHQHKINGEFSINVRSIYNILIYNKRSKGGKSAALENI